MQLMPQALYYLDIDSSRDDVPDWETIAVFSCAASCSLWPDGADHGALATAGLPQMSGAAAKALAGRRVTLGGLSSRAELNGRSGFILGYHGVSARWMVELEGTIERVRVRGSAITTIEPPLSSAGGYVEEFVHVQYARA